MRKAITLLLSVLLACSLAACGKQETENISPEFLAESLADTEDMKDGGDESERDTEGFSAVGYGGREYYGGVDFYPEHLEGRQKNFENGDITYCEARNFRSLSGKYPQA